MLFTGQFLVTINYIDKFSLIGFNHTL